VVVRDAQVTMGSLVLICKEDAEAFADVSAAAFAEQCAVLRLLTPAPQTFPSPAISADPLDAAHQEARGRGH
jgi:hypothetical protein